MNQTKPNFVLFPFQTFERKAIATARHLTQKLRNLMSNIGVPADRLPIIVQAQFERARELAQSLASSIPHDVSLLFLCLNVLAILFHGAVIV